jgi:plasmid stabilization system protein ParE
MHTVLVSRPAERDLKEQHDWWAEHRSLEQAARWYAGILKAIIDLEQHPERHPRAAEDGLWPYTVRQLNYGLGRKPSHRALFTIHNREVIVLRVRHVAQSPLTADDL